MEWILIAFIHAGPLAQGDSVALESVSGFKSKQSCEVAAKAMKSFVTGTAKEYRFACVQQ